MSRYAKYALALTAFAPALLIYAGVSALDGEFCRAIWLAFACAVLVIVCEDLLHIARTRVQSKSFHAAAVEAIDGEVFGFVLVYLLPLVTRDLDDYNWVVWVLIALFFCLVVAIGQGYHINPLLIIRKYHFYRVTEVEGIPHILITRRRIYKARAELTVARLADFVLLDKTPG